MSLSPAAAALKLRRSQAERRDQSERLLVHATLAVVAERGVHAATFEEIGRAAGYSRGLATQKFGSKRGLTEAVIAYLHRRRESILEADQVADMPALDAVEHYLERHVRDLTQQHGGRAYFMLLSAALADATSMREAFAASHERVRVWLEATLRRGQRDGDIRADVEPHTGALMIGSLALGISIQWLVDPHTDLEPLRATSIAALRRGLANPSPSPRPPS